MDPFQLFTTTNYTFLELDQTVDGNIIKSEHPTTGIVKVRGGMRQTGYGEIEAGGYVDNAPTVKVRPNEPFIASLDSNLVGHGIRLDGVDYRIIGQTPGIDFDEGTTVFYKVTLKREELASWDESSLPLS